MKVILYTTGCPKCNILKKKLKQKNIEHIEISDIETMRKKGYLTVPVLEVNGESMDFHSANDWINKLD